MTDTFDSDKFSNFTVTITDSDDTQRYQAEMYYGNGYFRTIGAGGYGLDSIDTNHDTTYFQIFIKTSICFSFPINITITDSEANILTRYTISEGEIDSSTIMTYRTIGGCFLLGQKPLTDFAKK